MVLQAQRPSNTGGEAERGAEHDSATSGSADMRRNGQAGGGSMSGVKTGFSSVLQNPGKQPGWEPLSQAKESSPSSS